MNERIEKLAEQAVLQANEVFDQKGKDYSGIVMEKFAELIVRECIAQCEFVANMATLTNNGEMARKTQTTAESCAKMIKKHFGVEE
jgi:translation initiation factor 6 (eIF-6)